LRSRNLFPSGSRTRTRSSSNRTVLEGRRSVRGPGRRRWAPSAATAPTRSCRGPGRPRAPGSGRAPGPRDAPGAGAARARATCPAREPPRPPKASGCPARAGSKRAVASECPAPAATARRGPGRPASRRGRPRDRGRRAAGCPRRPPGRTRAPAIPTRGRRRPRDRRRGRGRRPPPDRERKTARGTARADRRPSGRRAASRGGCVGAGAGSRDPRQVTPPGQPWVRVARERGAAAVAAGAAPAAPRPGRTFGRATASGSRLPGRRRRAWSRTSGQPVRWRPEQEEGERRGHAHLGPGRGRRPDGAGAADRLAAPSFDRGRKGRCGRSRPRLARRGRPAEVASPPRPGRRRRRRGLRWPPSPPKERGRRGKAVRGRSAASGAGSKSAAPRDARRAAPGQRVQHPPPRRQQGEIAAARPRAPGGGGGSGLPRQAVRRSRPELLTRARVAALRIAAHAGTTALRVRPGRPSAELRSAGHPPGAAISPASPEGAPSSAARACHGIGDDRAAGRPTPAPVPHHAHHAPPYRDLGTGAWWSRPQRQLPTEASTGGRRAAPLIGTSRRAVERVRRRTEGLGRARDDDHHVLVRGGAPRSA
jgi:hypothetical protein